MPKCSRSTFSDSSSDSYESRAATIILEITDFNDAGSLLNRNFKSEWKEIKGALETMPLHLKASDQAGKQGRPIFDPVGTNEAIKAALTPHGWQRIPIPTEFDFLGVGVDFGKNGVIAEVQFSNYPFLLNNTIRSELFFKSKIALTEKATKIAVIITKAHMFPASNSTLYYEQAVHQLTSLAKYKVFDVPIRLVGLFAERTGIIPAVWTGYTATRYSRTVELREGRRFIVSSRRPDGRCVFNMIEET
ncbi:MAG TPA: hypothetical protein VH575_15740 [Gemmataceae bacterium]